MEKPWIRLSRNKASALSFLSIFLWMAPFASAEWYKDYEAGVSAAKKNQCNEAIARLTAALREKPDEGASIKFYGMNFGDYFPHYYLGSCYFHLQNYKSALAEFEASEQHGQIQRKKDLWKQLNQLKTVAKAQLSVNSGPPIAQNPQPVTPTKTEPEKTKTPEPVKSPTTTPENTQVITEPVKKPEPPAPKPPEPVPAEPEKTPQQIAAEKAKGFLQSAARKYFQGDYDTAIGLLSSALNAVPNDLRAHFLLGCCYSAKYLLAGGQDQNLLQKASANFQIVKRMAPNYAGNKTAYISPAILDIYNKTGV